MTGTSRSPAGRSTSPTTTRSPRCGGGRRGGGDEPAEAAGEAAEEEGWQGGRADLRTPLAESRRAAARQLRCQGRARDACGSDARPPPRG